MSGTFLNTRESSRRLEELGEQHGGPVLEFNLKNNRTQRLEISLRFKEGIDLSVALQIILYDRVEGLARSSRLESVATFRRGRTWSRSLTPTWALSLLPHRARVLIRLNWFRDRDCRHTLSRTISLCNGRESCATSNTAHSLAIRGQRALGGEMEARCAIHLPRSSLSREFHFTDYVAVPPGTPERSSLLLVILAARRFYSSP